MFCFCPDWYNREASDPAADGPRYDEVEEAGYPHTELSPNDLFIKDAFLVFRALCKLTMKPLNSERYVKIYYLTTPFD